MAEYVGKEGVYTWVWSGGTVNFSSDWRTFSYSPTIEILDATAGSDAAKVKIVSFKDGSMSLTLVDQGGTTLDAACTEGVGGTLFWSPAGTATNSPKYSAAAICKGQTINPQYNQVVERQISWEQNGARSDNKW